MGKGLGNSTQKYLYLPEAYTDFIFPIAVEEFGLAIGICIVLGYVFILARILIIAKRASNLRNSIICYGIFIYILLHLLINFNFRRNSSTLPENDFKCLYLATRLLTQIQR